MSFTEEPRPRYQFGDLFYGLDGPRDGFYGPREKLIKVFHKDNESINKNLHTIDQFPINADESVTKNAYAEKTIENRDNLDLYYSFLDALKNHPRYKSIISATNEAVDWDVWRRKCKCGLYWAVCDNKRIHFCLDKLDIDDILGYGTKFSYDGKPHNKSVTSAELRWIFRYQMVPEVIRNVSFWKVTPPNGKIAQSTAEFCRPPWVSESERWSKYKSGKPLEECYYLKAEARSLFPSGRGG